MQDHSQLTAVEVRGHCQVTSLQLLVYLAVLWLYAITWFTTGEERSTIAAHNGSVSSGKHKCLLVPFDRYYR